MRALVVQPGAAFSVQDVYTGWVAGLRANGVDVVDLNLTDRLNFYTLAHIKVGDDEYRQAFDQESAAILAAQGIKSAAYECWPDLVVVVSGFYTPPGVLDLLRARHHKVVLICTESPYEDDRQLERAHHADLVVLNDPTNIDQFRQVTKTVYIPHSYNPAIHRPGPADPACRSEFCFVGTGYPSRIDFFETVDWTGIDATFAGHWHLDDDSPLIAKIVHDIDDCIDNEDTVRLYQSTSASANLYRREATRPDLETGWAMGPREVELAATGTFFLRDPRPESDEILGMLPAFSDPGDFGDKLRWWLAHPDIREATAGQARHAVTDRTFTNAAAGLLRLV